MCKGVSQLVLVFSGDNFEVELFLLTPVFETPEALVRQRVGTIYAELMECRENE